MPDRPQDRESTLISEQAADWLVYLKEGSLGVNERRRYVRWLKQSPAHIAEVLRLSNLDGLLRTTDLDDILPLPVEADPPDASNVIESNVIEFAPHRAPADTSPEIIQRPVLLRRWRLAASVAVLALSLLLGTVAKFAWFDNIIETEASEWRHFTLADGSIARVGPRSRLRVEFEDRQRSIYLSRGEAVFQVAKDPARPFLVHAQMAVVRAVGTEFGVAHQRNTVVVTVAEGKVAVSQGGSAVRVRRERNHSHTEESPGNDGDADKNKEESKRDESVAVSAGEQVSVARDRPMTVQPVDPVRELAWAQGKLIFNSDTTLAQAIEQFNRRNRIQIAVEDHELASSLVCCIFSADDPESFALSVATKDNVSLVREGADRLRLVVAVQRELPGSQPLMIEEPAK